MASGRTLTHRASITASLIMAIRSKRINSCQRGKRIERALRDVLRMAGYCKSIRGQQHSGSPDSPDVICPELPDIFWESKGEQNSKPHQWLGKALSDSGGGKLPVVAWKRNHCDWVAFLYLDDLLEIIRRSDLPRLSNDLRHDAFITTETGCHHFRDKTVRECLDAMGVPHNGKGKIAIPWKNEEIIGLTAVDSETAARKLDKLNS